MWPTIQGASEHQKKAKQQNEDEDRVGSRTKQPGRREHQPGGRRTELKNKGGYREGTGTEWGGVQSSGQSAGPSTHSSSLTGTAVRIATFSFRPSLPWPVPYLTLVRPLRSVHLLDMSVQVIRPGEERAEKDFKTR